MLPTMSINYLAVLGLVLINASFDLTRLILFGFILSYWQ